MFNGIKNDGGIPAYYQFSTGVSLVQQIANALHHLKIQSVIVEGGAKLLQSFIDEGMWDEARVITNSDLVVGEGLAAPVLMNDLKAEELSELLNDKIELFRNRNV